VVTLGDVGDQEEIAVETVRSLAVHKPEIGFLLSDILRFLRVIRFGKSNVNYWISDWLGALASR
jgi:hypothetical protein